MSLKSQTFLLCPISLHKEAIWSIFTPEKENHWLYNISFMIIDPLLWYINTPQSPGQCNKKLSYYSG